jgi:hypothetical protein
MPRLQTILACSRARLILGMIVLALVIVSLAEPEVIAQPPAEDPEPASFLPIMGGEQSNSLAAGSTFAANPVAQGVMTATSTSEAGQAAIDLAAEGQPLAAPAPDPTLLPDSLQSQIFLPLVQREAAQGSEQVLREADAVEAAALPSFTVSTIDASMAGDVKAVGDINGDGYVDGVVGGDANGEDMVWYKYNPSNGSWTKYPVAEAVAQFTTDMQLGDIDKDGDLDVIVPEEAPGLLSWLENPRPAGNPQLGNWAHHNIATGMGHLHDVEVADFDRDGKLDVIARHGTYLTSDGNVFLFFQNTPTSWTLRTFPFPSGEGLGIGDIDQDGDTDFIVAGKWYENPPSPRTNPWSVHGIVGNPPAESTSAVADLNGDTRPDIVIVNQHANGTFAWYEGPVNPKTAANGTFPQRVINTNTGSHKVNVADFNKDGFIDIQTALELADMKIFYNSGGANPTFTLQTLQYSAHNARVGDIGRDGDIDIFGAEWTGHPPVRSWQNQLSSTPATPTPVTPPTATPTRTPTPVTPPTATPTRTPTSSADLIFADGFEAGTLAAWTAKTIGGGDLSARRAAALVGSYGLQAVINDNTALYVTDDHPNAEARYRVRFSFDPNSLVMVSGDGHYLFYGYSNTTPVVQVIFRFSNGKYQVKAHVRNDANTWYGSSWFSLSDAPHLLELDWQAATAAGANNGRFTLWIDGVQKASLTGIDNDTRRIDRARLGSVAGIDDGTRGTFYFDAFESRRQSYIGPASSGATMAALAPSVPLTSEEAVRLPTPLVATIVHPEASSTLSAELNGLGLQLFFPAQAVSAPVSVVLTSVAETTMPDGYTLLGSMFALQLTEANGAAVAALPQPFSLRIAYDSVIDSTSSGGEVSLQAWNGDRQAWEMIPATVNPADHTLTASLSRVATWALWQQEEVQSYQLYLPTIQR